ncbi:MAG TPA: alpha/beta hydrolase [Thiolinea sp.]|nr:alpha/beta hydrolase [Thiolinea sp.]
MASLRGTGEPLLFLGGTGSDLRHPGAHASLLTRHFTVLAFDQRGMGQSDKPPGPYRMQDYATDAMAILDAVNWTSVHVVGYSFGGMVAQELAIRAPERVRTLTLIATTAGGAGGSSWPIHELLGLPDKEAARKSLEILDLDFSPAWQQQHPQDAEHKIRRRMQQMAACRNEPGARAGLLAQLGARARHDTYARLGQISAPTLVLAGIRDGQAPLAAQQRMAERIPHCRFETCPGGHAYLFESDALYQRIITTLNDPDWSRVP